MAFKYQSSVIFVDDVDVSREFYERLLGQVVEMDHGRFVAFAGGFGIWESDFARTRIFGRSIEEGQRDTGVMELYFETDDIEASAELLRSAGTPMIHGVQEEPWGQRTFRCYDPDGHILEVAEPMRAVVERLVRAGHPLEKIAERTTLPMELILQIIGYPRFC